MISNIDFRELQEGVNLDNFGIGIDPITVDNMNFNRILLARCVGSSKEAALQSLDKMMENIDERKYLDHEKTTKQLLELRELIEKKRIDENYDRALAILRMNPSKKTIINVPSAVTCEACSGVGSEGGVEATNCPTCSGMGKVRAQQGFFTVERTCPTCAGKGQIIKNPCKMCSGQGRVDKERKLNVTIPPSHPVSFILYINSFESQLTN